MLEQGIEIIKKGKRNQMLEQGIEIIKEEWRIKKNKGQEIK